MQTFEAIVAETLLHSSQENYSVVQKHLLPQQSCLRRKQGSIVAKPCVAETFLCTQCFLVTTFPRWWGPLHTRSKLRLEANFACNPD